MRFTFGNMEKIFNAVGKDYTGFNNTFDCYLTPDEIKRGYKAVKDNIIKGYNGYHDGGVNIPLVAVDDEDYQDVMNGGRKYGFELEVLGNRETIVNTVHNSTLGGFVKLETDSSLSDEGLELISGVMSDKALLELKDDIYDLISALRAGGCRTDSSCGLHVHVSGFSDKCANNILRFGASEAHSDEFRHLTGRSTFNNRYCRPLDREIANPEPRSMEDLTRLSNGMYSAVRYIHFNKAKRLRNRGSFHLICWRGQGDNMDCDRFNHIEVRAWRGATSPTLTVARLMLTRTMFEYAQRGTLTLENLLKSRPARQIASERNRLAY